MPMILKPSKSDARGGVGVRLPFTTQGCSTRHGRSSVVGGMLHARHSRIDRIAQPFDACTTAMHVQELGHRRYNMR